MFHILYPCINFSHVDSLYNTWMKVYTFYHVQGVVCIFLKLPRRCVSFVQCVCGSQLHWRISCPCLSYLDIRELHKVIKTTELYLLYSIEPLQHEEIPDQKVRCHILQIGHEHKVRQLANVREQQELTFPNCSCHLQIQRRKRVLHVTITKREKNAEQENETGQYSTATHIQSNSYICHSIIYIFEHESS